MAKCFFKLAIPAVTSNVAGFLCLMVNSAFASQLDDPVYLAAVGIGNVCSFIFVISILTGLNSAQDTLTSQAFGNGDIRLCGAYLNRGRIILSVFFIPLAVLPSCFAEQILLGLGQNPQVSRLAHGYIQMFLPGMFCFGQFDLLKRFLAAMQITFVPMLAQLIASALHLPLCYFLVFQKSMGIRGLGLATSITNFNLLLIAMIYAHCNPVIKRALFAPSANTLRGWSEYLKVSLPSTVMICSEWWAFEVLTVISGLISIEAQAVQTIVTSGCAILFEVPLGFQEASCAIIGNCIGAGNVPLASRFFRFTSYVTLATVIALQTVIFFGRDAIAAFYSTNEEVRELTSKVLILVTVIFFFDGMQGYLQGPIRAVGLQKLASLYTFVCYYCIGIPLSCFLALKKDMGVIGLQIGIGVAIALQCSAYVHVLLRSDWQKVTDEAHKRIKFENEKVSDQEVTLLTENDLENDCYARSI